MRAMMRRLLRSGSEPMVPDTTAGVSEPGSSFAEAIRVRYGLAPEEEPADDTVRMWLEFALSSLDRGRYAVTAMGGPEAFRGRDVLDVGCAYGGFLVAAHEAGARSVSGIDVNEDLLGLARLQFQDYGVEGRLELRDITADVSDLGLFDVILCNDVLEHVSDPAVAAIHLASLLRTGGRIFLQIPNGSAVEFMLRDGHYGLLGITLLDRARAERLWGRSFFDQYGVEHYAPLVYYLDVFSRAGISLRLITALPEDLDAVVADLALRFEELEDRLEKLDLDDADLLDEIRRRGAHERERFRHLAGLHAQSDVRAERDVIARTLWDTYGPTFWELIGTRTP